MAEEPIQSLDQSSEQDLTCEGDIKLHAMNFYFVQPSVLDKV